MDKIDALVEILLDKTSRIDERDDAAMHLGEFDDDRGLNALLSIVLDPREDPFIMDVCGESIASIWIKRNNFDFHHYEKMNTAAKQEIYGYIERNKPEWLLEYNL